MWLQFLLSIGLGAAGLELGRAAFGLKGVAACVLLIVSAWYWDLACDASDKRKEDRRNKEREGA